MVLDSSISIFNVRIEKYSANLSSCLKMQNVIKNDLFNIFSNLSIYEFNEIKNRVKILNIGIGENQTEILSFSKI